MGWAGWLWWMETVSKGESLLRENHILRNRFYYYSNYDDGMDDSKKKKQDYYFNEPNR